MKLFDKEHFYKYVGEKSSSKKGAEMVALLIDEVEKIITVIEDQGEDRKVLVNSIHTIKGICAYAGLLRLEYICTKLESSSLYLIMDPHHVLMVVRNEWDKVLIELNRSKA